MKNYKDIDFYLKKIRIIRRNEWIRENVRLPDFDIDLMFIDG